MHSGDGWIGGPQFGPGASKRDVPQSMNGKAAPHPNPSIPQGSGDRSEQPKDIAPRRPRAETFGRSALPAITQTLPGIKLCGTRHKEGPRRMKDFNVSHFEERGRSPIAPTTDVPGGWIATLLRAITNTSADDVNGVRHAGVPSHFVEERWGKHLSLHTIERLEKSDVVACGAFDDAERSHIADIGAYGRTFRTFDTQRDVAAYLNRSFASRQLVIFQIRDLMGAIARLEEFRCRFPQSAVVLICPELARNDFTGERRTICDASLRSADGRASIAMAVTVALQNHSEYLARGIY
mgnify:CR=1 FL=1